MNIQNILPEIIKGRRFRVVGTEGWMTKPFVLRDTDLELDWELEPEDHEIREGINAFPHQDGFLIKSHLSSYWQPILGLSHKEIDALHAASLKTRGIDKPQGIIQDTTQYTGPVDPFWVEYHGLSYDSMMKIWPQFTGRAVTDGAEAMFKAGWDAHYKALKGEG